MKKIVNDLINLGVDLSTRYAFKKALRILGEEPDNADRIYIELKNRIFRDRVSKMKPEEKILFLPHCMRKADKCKPKVTDEGYNCNGCTVTGCRIYQIKDYAENKGYKVFTVPGGSMVFNVIKRHRPKGVIGIACMKELILAAENLSIPAQYIELDNDGCINTKVDMEKVRKYL